jgi:hypothetical protein
MTNSGLSVGQRIGFSRPWKYIQASGNLAISDALELQNSGDQIVLLDYYECYRSNVFDNLIRCNNRLQVVWLASAPGGSKDLFTAIEWTERGIKAYTHSSCECIVDPSNGEIIECMWMK